MEALPEVLLLGDPRLREQSRPVGDVRDPIVVEQGRTLHQVLATLRERHGFGRAIAARQLGFPGRLIALHLDRPLLLFNPEIVCAGSETFTLWDDCFSFPDLLVKVRRHVSIDLRFVDECGASRGWSALPRDVSELLQHEIDHLDGVLAVDRAIDKDSIVYRSVFEARRAEFDSQVDGVQQGA